MQVNIIFLDKSELRKKMNQFISLFEQCFTAEVSQLIVKQRFLDNPYDDILMCIAEDNGTIIANYSAVPVRLQIEGVEHKAALSLNTMTHPDYEGQGLFTRLASSLCDYMESEGYSMVYSFPNHLTNGILYSKLGWKDIYEIPTLELTLSDNNIHYFNQKLHPKTNYWSSISTNTPSRISVKKDDVYLKWRYQDNPYNDYEISRFGHYCWAVHHVYEDELNLTEFHHDGSKEMIYSMISYYIHLANNLKLKKVTTWCGINTIAHSAFERIGFVNKTPIRYFSGKVLDYDGLVDLYDYRNWNIQMGDDNVY